jgi:hypothetical protein
MEHLVLQLLKSRHGRIIVALLSILGATFFGVFAWPNVSDAMKLARHHEHCLANVIEHRTTTGMHYFDGTYDIRYMFEIPRRGVYVQSEKGPLARQELWSSLPKQEWLQAIRTGVVPVAYSKQNPLINALERDVKSNAYSLYAFSIISVAGIAAASIWLVRLLFFWSPPSLTNVQWYIKHPTSNKLLKATPSEAKTFFKHARASRTSFRID